MDSLTPVNGSDVRMLRMLTARHLAAKSVSATAFFDNDGGGGIGGGANACSENKIFDAEGFLEEWFVAEEREENLWRSSRASANVHVNTALPYDLNVLKVSQNKSDLARITYRYLPPVAGAVIQYSVGRNTRMMCVETYTPNVTQELPAHHPTHATFWGTPPMVQHIDPRFHRSVPTPLAAMSYPFCCAGAKIVPSRRSVSRWRSRSCGR